ncbi:MAG: SDR family oxidoreductase [Bacteroidales bacterium]|nr:SDR family oxidoreductase [Bacteroidales bacterium]
MKPNRIALITGASSGIGRVFAQRFAQSGYDLIITGRRRDKLTLLAEQLKGRFSISVKIVIAELSEENDVRKLLKVIATHDNISVLINNAGYGSGKEFGNCDLNNHMQMLQVHVVTTLKLVHAVLPQMISRRSGTIINVSSLAAFMPAPGSSVYSATKLFLKSFTESLHMEVSRYGIKLQCLCPGFTHTDFHERRVNGNIPKNSGIIRWMEADTVVDECLKSLEKGKIVYVPGFMNRLLVMIVPFIPSFIYYYLMMKIAQRTTGNGPIPDGKSGKVQPAL